jgi:light-regulated signal transduction histidine kinase (bacteriophytochrome)
MKRNHDPAPSQRAAIRIAAVYALIGGTWILSSGWILRLVVFDEPLAIKLEYIKGWFYVLATAVLLGWWLNYYFRKIRTLNSELKHLNANLEAKVKERTALLEAANKELEAFSYSVSHDLRAPLRHINGYVEMLNKEYRGQMDEKAGHYLDIVSGASRQMGTLIDDLLKFSRTGRKELSTSEVDLNAVVQEVLHEMNPVLKERKIVWNIQELPKVFGDDTLLKLVWANLLDNAIKYTRKKEEAEISVGYRTEAKEFVFYVRDNGTGFDMKYAKKLFGVFQRLHSQAEFEGSGIGLANVQRIIHKHSGQVWAEAEPGKGATFYFSLPVAANR